MEIATSISEAGNLREISSQNNNEFDIYTFETGERRVRWITLNFIQGEGVTLGYSPMMVLLVAEYMHCLD